MTISVFELFRVGIGPSSSHTVGPMRAARSFAGRVASHPDAHRVRHVRVHLYGSLGATRRENYVFRPRSEEQWLMMFGR